MTDDSIVAESLLRPKELSNGTLDSDKSESAELELIATEELKQLLNPAADEVADRIEAGPQAENEDDNGNPGFDPYNRG